MAFIGKNVIENLTTAMYEDLRIIYREYIQNAADSIDKAVAQGIISSAEARIDVEIDAKNRTITVRDNGLGINSANFQKVMSSIADSEKNRSEEKGFRGIGRLGGISSCEKLRFSCSAIGETAVSICTWNAKEVREILVDKSRNPSASELVDSVTEYSSDSCELDEHFFKVELISVEQSSMELLDINRVKDYLCAVAPIPYAVGFMFKSRISDFAKKNGFVIDEYQVFVNGERLFKPYTTNLYEPKNNSKQTYDSLVDVEFEIFTDSNEQVLAWMWYGISKFEKQIPSINPMRGIRLRKGNIQIGNENTFSAHDFYDESRGCLYFVGEVFAVSSNLIPNARRDYFNLNNTCREFEHQLRPLFCDRFKKIYHYANDYKKALQKQQDLASAQAEYQSNVEKGRFLDADDKQKAEEIIDEKKKIAEKAAKQIETRNSKEQADDVLTKVYTALRSDYPVTPKVPTKSEDTPAAKPAQKGKQYMTQSLSQYNKKEQKLISHIYRILSAILPHDTATMVINKIQEELSK
jgi:molecular chaperone HtpG